MALQEWIIWKKKKLLNNKYEWLSYRRVRRIYKIITIG